VERGLLPPGEAESARAEAGRRLIAAASGSSSQAPANRRTRLAAAALIAVGLPAVAFPLYGRLGRPTLPDEPLASRPIGPHNAGEIEAAVAAVEKRLIAKPDDGKGWAVIAPVYMRLERYADAAHAYSEALRLLGEDPLRRSAYGEALVAAAGGVVTDDARQQFDRALAEQPGQPQARFYVALAAEQDGKKADAARDYESLLADSPPEAPWRTLVDARLAALKGEPAPPKDAAAIPAEQRPMIEGMVSRLATRLASNGGSVDEWSRLIRAYTVLHEADRAKAALADAHKALAANANAVASLDALARDLGLGDAN
jgi:cytochrome c-type biogenesis protein CcmH